MSDEIKDINANDIVEVVETEEIAPTVYNYDKETGEFIGTEIANPNPREGGWLLPGHATFTAPPEKGEKQAQCFNAESGEWELVPDHRGEKWYNKQTQIEKEIKNVGEAPDEELYTQVKPNDGAAKWDEESQSWKVPFATQKERKKASVISYYDGIMAVTKQGYSQGEIDTWQLQAQGAEDLLAGNTDTEAAKFVAALAQARQAAGDTQMTPEYLAQRIKVNAAAAAALQVPVMGKQGAEWAAADKATTEAELDSIVPYFDLAAFMAEQAEA